MTAKPYRVPANAGDGTTGRLVDRTNRLSFTFDGRRHTGFAGDTLASALMANGVRLMGRSFKYHRPRGLVGAGSEEPNALVGVGEGARHEPNLRATQVELYDGLTAVSQNRWPNLDLDVGQMNGLASRLFPAGFYYKTFMWPKAFWEKVYEPVIRNAAGLGKAPEGRDPHFYEQLHVSCDVLVIGAGVAGLAAAEAAAARGARVILADENARFGGSADIAGGTIAGASQLDWVRERTAALAAADNVHLLARTTVAGHYHHNHVMMLERVADHDPSLLADGTPRHRLWKVRARQIVLAAGAIERPIPFANNDRPGVLLASAARAMLARYGVAPGQRGVIFANNDDAYRTALALTRAGVTVARIVDAREVVDGPLADEARTMGLAVMPASAVSNVETGLGGRSITGARIAPYHAGASHTLKEETVACDFVCVSGGYNPAVHVWCHNGGKLRFDEAIHSFRPDRTQDALRAVGACNGTFALADILEDGYGAGDMAARDALGATAPAARAVRAPDAEQEPQGSLEPVWFVPATGKYNEGNKHFIDYQNDVTAADLELALREGYESVEHVKRYTTLGMATDQGKTSNITGLGVMSGATRRAIPDIGTTTFRPPYTPISFGSIAGSHAGSLFLPVRRTAAYDWHVGHGADFEPVGQWRRPYCYPQDGESRHDAVNREILAVRNRVGLLDASTLGKIEVKGPDAAAFLDRLYTNTYSTLKVGRCRYGLMMNEKGFLFDDGVTARLGDDHYLVHTTSGNAEHIAAWMEEWLQTEWTDYKVFVTPVTEQWAQFAIAGPKAREVLEALGTDIDVSRDALPFMGFATGHVAGYPVRLYRISFSGELSFEIATPAHFGRGLWDEILAAGSPHGMEVYGTEALHVLRAEKGFIAIGDETDGTVTPLDLGLSWAVSKKKADYLGKRSLQLPHLAAEGRKQLVGLLTDDPKEVLPDGAYAVEKVLPKPPMSMIGQVSSTYWSPTLERSIALALIRDGRERMGETVSFPLEDRVVTAQIVEPVFFDKEGERQNV